MATALGPAAPARRRAAGDRPGASKIVEKPRRPPGRNSRLHALSTESLARSQHSTSVWTIASKLWAWKGSALAAAATTLVRAARLSARARAAATRSPSSGRSARTTRQPLRAARYSPRPAPPRADVQQPLSGRQAEPAGELVGLDHGGVAVGAPVATDDPPLDLHCDRRGGDAIALLEQGPCLQLVPDGHGLLTVRSRRGLILGQGAAAPGQPRWAARPGRVTPGHLLLQDCPMRIPLGAGGQGRVRWRVRRGWA